MRFGQSILYRKPTSHIQKLKFFLFGHEFIGAEIRKAHFVKALKKISVFSRVADAGCGTGDFSFFLSDKCQTVNIVAYDIKKEVLQKNQEIKNKNMIKNITFVEQDLLTLKEKEKYDFIFSIGTLIYFSKNETKKILQNLTDALQKNGYLYLDLPQRDFLEVSYIYPKRYQVYYDALQAENSGDLYSYDEMKQLLVALGYDLIWSNKSFSFPGKFAWEFDNVLKEKKLLRLRFFFLPFLKSLAMLDSMTKHKKGCCFVILARKKV